MATLTRPRTAPEAQRTSSLHEGVPSPFPVDQLQRPTENPFETVEEATKQEDGVAGSSQSTHETLQSELLPSITTLQKSCLMTLNNLLSGSEQWKSIVPDRRHSMPNTPGTSSATEAESSSALQTLVSNLRTRTPTDTMIEITSANDDTSLLLELRNRINQLSPTLAPRDAALATSLVTLLSYFDRLSILQTQPGVETPRPIDTPSQYHDAPPPIDMFDALTRHLNDVQIDRLSSQLASSSSNTTQFETAILWSQIDKELDSVVTMCKERTEGLPRFYQEMSAPPQYEYDPFESLPEYDGTGRPSLDLQKTKTTESSSRLNDEKMRLDLEGVAMAIDRLYLVAPQLHNQRVELDTSKLERLAHLAKKAESKKGKEKDVKELENIIEMLGKASERSYKDQTVVLDGNEMQNRLAKAKQKDRAQRDAFVEGLLKHSSAGRLHGQDAVLQPKVKDPQAMLTLPEFIREAIPPDSELLRDPSVMLTLPEFVAQGPPEDVISAKEEKKKSRVRSLSAPARSWLRHSRSKSNLGLSSSSKQKSSKDSTFDIVYVAENHENLNRVVVVFTVTKQTPGIELTAEVLPPFPDLSEGGDHLIIRSGVHSSLPLMLPARTTPGKKTVQAHSGHFEIRLDTIKPTPSTEEHPPEDTLTSPLLDATQLSNVAPTSFLCASCSLPLIQSSKVTSYRDLPSEHWEELVEAWMCHSDMKLHDQIMRYGKAGFWPKPDLAYVGGSYVLFEKEVIVQQNLLAPQTSKIHENWKLCRCLCGAVVGRSQERPITDPEDTPSTCFRMLKYAIRPVTPNPADNKALKIPLSAFVVEDMMEFVNAHATYRFVIKDEESEKPRILVWLFKPRMRLAYTTPKPRALPKNASIVAAKVLYKLIGPADAATDLASILDRYPGFPKAEFLSYPMSVCQRLASLLKESNTAYPEGLRTMTGLEVGWLHRR